MPDETPHRVQTMTNTSYGSVRTRCNTLGDQC